MLVIYVSTEDEGQIYDEGEGRPSARMIELEVARNQYLNGTINVHTLRWLLKKRAEHVWMFPDCDDANS